MESIYGNKYISVFLMRVRLEKESPSVLWLPISVHNSYYHYNWLLSSVSFLRGVGLGLLGSLSLRTALWGRERRIAAPVSHFPSRSSLSGFWPGSHPRYPAPHPRAILLQRPPPPPLPARAQRPLSAPRPPRFSPPHRSRPAPLPVPTPGRVPAPLDQWFRAFLHGGAGLERTRPPWSCSSFPGPREMSGQLSRPRVATRSLVRNKQILLGSQAPDIHSGGTLPSHHSPIISPQLWKKQPSFLFRKGPVFSLQLPSTWAPAGPQSVGKHYPPFSLQGGSSARISPATTQERQRRRGGLSGCSWALAILRGGGVAAAAMRRAKGRGCCGRGRGRGAELARPGRRLRRRLESGQRRR